MGSPVGGLVTAVRPGSLGEELGIRQGDRILAINGQPLRDVIDYLDQVSGETIVVSVERANGERLEFDVEKESGESLGVEFGSVAFDRVKQCHNRCVFCFVDQLPPGLRPSLYVKDDDYRLSFCQGNYITLTNLTQDEVDRIKALRLSPLYVSVHTLDPDLRRALLRNPRGGEESLAILRDLVSAGISLHVQLVLCPGWNDGTVLERTLRGLALLGEGVESVAAVPVGVTRHRRDPVPLRTFTAEEAAAVVDLVHFKQAEFFRTRGSRLVFLADEFYLRAERPVPASAAYEDFAQLEDGVGLVRKFWDESQEAMDAAGPGGEDCHVVTGVAGVRVIQPLLLGLRRLGRNCRARLLVVRNNFFDPQGTTVTGLLTGADIAAAALRARERGELIRRLLVPDVVFRSGEGVTLDDLSAEELAARCEAPVEVVPTCGGELVRRLCG